MCVHVVKKAKISLGDVVAVWKQVPLGWERLLAIMKLVPARFSHSYRAFSFRKGKS